MGERSCVWIFESVERQKKRFRWGTTLNTSS